MPLFDEYLHEDNISNALLVGRNMVNKEPQNVALFSKYVDLLLSLADKLPIMEERKDFLNQAILTLAFFEENADLTPEIITIINEYHNHINDLAAKMEKENAEVQKQSLEQLGKSNTEVIKKLYKEKEELEKVSNQTDLDKELSIIGELDSKIIQDKLTTEQKEHYEKLNKEYNLLISEKMADIARMESVDYNKNAVDAFEKAFLSFKKDEGKYKNQTQLFDLVSKTLFAYDASRLFNETLIYYNHVYSYIFGKLDDDGKLAITRYSIECERKLR